MMLELLSVDKVMYFKKKNPMIFAFSFLHGYYICVSISTCPYARQGDSIKYMLSSRYLMQGKASRYLNSSVITAGLVAVDYGTKYTILVHCDPF